MNIFGNNERTPPLKPRQIHFTSKSTNEANTISPLQLSSITEIPSLSFRSDGSSNPQLQEEVDHLKSTLEDKLKLISDMKSEIEFLKNSFEAERTKFTKDIDSLKGQIVELKSKIQIAEKSLAEAKQKSTEFDTMNKQLQEERANNAVIKEQLNSMDNTIKLKDEVISKYQKDLYNFTQNEKIHLETINRLQREKTDLVDGNEIRNDSTSIHELQEEIDRLKEILAETERELSEKMIDCEKYLLDIAEQEKTIFHLNDVLTDSKTARSVEELRIQIRSYRDKNDELQEEVRRLMDKLRTEKSSSPIPTAIDETGIDEITSRVEKELNYSAQLDSSIMKAIETEEIHSDDENYFDKNENDTQIAELRVRNKQLETTIEQLQHSIEIEKEKFSLIHKQDASCIESMTKRLEAAIDCENKLTNALDEEKSKTAQLSTKMLEHQFERSKLSTSMTSLNDSPIASPRRLQKGGELEQELLKRQNDEIKLLKSQLEREKERALDTEETLAREKNRFETELHEQKSYGDGLKDEIDRMIRENQSLQDELEQTQNR